MLSSINPTSITNSSVSCWPALEPALNKLFPSPAIIAIATTNTPPHFDLGSEDYLKLYTVVFDHCVGLAEGRREGKSASAALPAGLNISGEELYLTLVKYLETRFEQWSIYLIAEIEKNSFSVLSLLLNQLDRVQVAEKPLTFIFTYLERHWIDRQINEPRVDILPMKQLIWTTWDKIVLEKVFASTALVLVDHLVGGVRAGQVPLEDLGDLAKFVHYLRVISKPAQLESDYKATKRVTMAGAVINQRAVHQDRFKDFVQAYCTGITRDCPKMTENVHEFVQAALKFWNEEEGRMAFMRFDKSAQVTVRNHLKSLLLLPHLEGFKAAFKDSIKTWNVLAANAVYRLLANRKSLLVNLDSESETAFIEKGRELILAEFEQQQQQQQQQQQELESVDFESLFVSVVGQYYNMIGELIQTSFASRVEMFESRSKAFRSILNNPPNGRKGFASRSLAKFADFIIRNFPDSSGDNLQVLLALFKLIDDKEEFLDSYGKLLALRLLTGFTTRIPCTFERNLLKEFKTICGPFFVKSFEKMFLDFSEKDLSSSLTVLTGGTWNIRGKLLPGHSALLNSNEQFNWPEPLNQEIDLKSKIYYQKYPKRKLFWSPLLTSIEFNYNLNSKAVFTIKSSCLHFNILETISETKIYAEGLTKLFGPFALDCLNSLILLGLVSKLSDGSFSINQNFESESKELDLYTLTLTELLSTKGTYSKNGNNLLNQSSTSTPRPSSSSSASASAGTQTSNYFSNNNTANNQSHTSPIDKSILLQCAITRILKQLRVLGLPDLFNRISMLPKLLTRFSPSLKDLLDALKQLHEKEFVKLALGDGIDDLVDVNDEDLIHIYNENQCNIFIKYLA